MVMKYQCLRRDFYVRMTRICERLSLLTVCVRSFANHASKLAWGYEVLNERC